MIIAILRVLLVLLELLVICPSAIEQYVDVFEREERAGGAIGPQVEYWVDRERHLMIIRINYFAKIR